MIIGFPERVECYQGATDAPLHTQIEQALQAYAYRDVKARIGLGWEEDILWEGVAVPDRKKRCWGIETSDGEGRPFQFHTFSPEIPEELHVEISLASTSGAVSAYRVNKFAGAKQFAEACTEQLSESLIVLFVIPHDDKWEYERITGKLQPVVMDEEGRPKPAILDGAARATGTGLVELPSGRLRPTLIGNVMSAVSSLECPYTLVARPGVGI